MLTHKLIPSHKSLITLLFCLCIMPVAIRAQLCAGSIGDAVFTESFDNNGALPQGVTGLAAANGCPGPGEYLLTNFIFGCKANGPWQPTGGDHTRTISKNQHSNEMLINGSGFSGLVYTAKAGGLCGNITYQFSAFIANMMQSTTCGGSAEQPNLTFTVTDAQGAVLQTYNTGGIATEGFVDWKQYGLFFTTPASPTPVTLTITGKAFGCGAVFALDDITLRPCGTKVTVTLDNDTLPFIDVCDGYKNPFVLKASYLGFNNPKTGWQVSLDTGQTWQDVPGAVNSTYAIPRFTDTVKMYRIIVAEDVNFSSPKCRVASAPIWVGVHPAPKQQPVTYVSACFNKDATMPFIKGGVTYLWLGPNGYTSINSQAVITKIQYADTGLYKVIAISDYGCTTTDSVYVSVSPSVTLQVTTSFNVCEGNKIQFDASGGGTYLWSPATNLSSPTIPNPTLQVKDSARYQVLIANQYGCKDSAVVAVNVYRRTKVWAGPDKYLFAGDTTTLDAVVTGTGLTSYWVPNNFINNAQLLNPKISPPLGDWQYTLYVSSAQGCGNGTGVVKVHVYNNLYIPDAFTPNGDGKNDVFGIMPMSKFKVTRFTIYSRWGSVLFTTATPGATWDGNLNGQPQPPGAYIYYAEMILPDGKKYTRKGTVMLIR